MPEGRLQRIRFDAFVLDRDQGVLLRHDRAVSLRPKTWALLLYFVERPGRLATKAELLDALWPDTNVNESAVANCVSELRNALGDDPRQPRYVEISHRRGYRWIAAVADETAQASAGQAIPRQQPPAGAERVTVGRAGELRQLIAAVERALGGRRQLIFATGEAGIGKTTLVDTLLADRDLLPPEVLIGRGQCVEHHGLVEPYLPVLDALSDFCRGPQGGRGIDVLRTHAPMWLAQLPSLLSAAERASISSEIQGAARERMLREMGEALDELAAETPVLLVLEDLHWSDHATVDLLSYLARRRAPARLMILATYRPVNVLVNDHPLRTVKRDLQARDLCREVALDYLTEAEIAEYLDARFPDHRLPASLAQMIHRQTDGNPLFMVSVTEFLVGRGWLSRVDEHWQLTVPLADVAGVVPDSLKQMIERQIDELPGETARLLEAASLVGTEFATQALAVAAEMDVEDAESRCDALARRQQMLRVGGAVAWPDGTHGMRYAFAHAIYQHAFYERTPPARRRRLHRQIGARIEEGWGARGSEVSVELASHFDRGGDLERAVRYLKQSAASALQRGAAGDARMAFERALELIDPSPETPERTAEQIELTLGVTAALQSLGGLGQPALEPILQRVVELGDRMGSPLSRFRALVGLFLVSYFSGRRDEADGRCRQLTDVAAQVEVPIVSQAALALEGCNLNITGAFGAARAACEKSLAIDAPPLPYGRPPIRVVATTILSRALTLMGFPDRGTAAYREAMMAARISGPFATIFTVAFGAVRAAWIGDVGAAREAAQEAGELLEQYGFTASRPFVDAPRGWVAVKSGAVDEGIALIRNAISARAELGLHGESGLLHWLHVDALLGLGRSSETMAAIDAAVAHVELSGEMWSLADLHRARGECLRLQGNAGAQRCFEQAIELAQTQKADWWELRAATALARLGGRKRDVAALRAVYERFTEGFDTPDLREARALLA